MDQKSSENNHNPDDTSEDLQENQKEYKINSKYEDFLQNTACKLDRSNLDQLDRIIESASLELPKSLIITNMDIRIFNDSTEERLEFEKAFRNLDPEVKFLYFKSFRRARLDFTTNQAATKARIILNQVKFGDEAINCYFAEISNAPSNKFLKPPALEKQFLISPPASPPEGWEAVEEAQPILNIDLQSALANLLPGSTHELHPPTTDQPAIVVHICSDSSTINAEPESNDGDFSSLVKTKMKIAQTPCPPSMQKLHQNEF